MIELEPTPKLIALYVITSHGIEAQHDLTSVAVDQGVLFAYRQHDGKEADLYGWPLSAIQKFEITEQPTRH